MESIAGKVQPHVKSSCLEGGRRDPESLRKEPESVPAQVAHAESWSRLASFLVGLPGQESPMLKELQITAEEKQEHCVEKKGITFCSPNC